MKKSFCMMITCALLSAMFAGCSGNTPASDPGSSSSVTGNPSVSSPELDTAAPESSGDDSIDTAGDDSSAAAPSAGLDSLPITDLTPDAAAIKSGLKQAVSACLNVFDVSKVPENAFPDPTHEDYGRMLEQLASLGLAVEAGDYNMQNYEAVTVFYENAKAGKDGQISIYSIRNYGVSSYTFVSKGGQISCTLAAVDFTEPENPSVDPTGTVTRFEMTDGGHLLFKAVQEGLSDTLNGFCVLPHSEELRTLRRTYIDPVGYSAGGTLTTNWDKDNLSNLNWEFLFETLYTHDTGVYLFDAFTETYPGDDSRLAIPAAEVEAVLEKYFPVTADTLHQLSRYDADLNVYAWSGFMGGGYSPEPEVIRSRENPDGSLTLTVGALSLEMGEEYAYTNEVTVMPRADGSFQYLSNQTDASLRVWPND